MRYSILILVFGILLTSCGGEDTAALEKATMEANYAAQQVTYDAVMETHDRVMPLNGKITAAQRTIMEQLKGADEMDNSKKEILEATNEQLEDANDGMMNWMNNFSTLNELREVKDHESIISYFEEEAAKIAKVEMSMKAALGAAAEVVGETAGHSHDGHDHGGHDHGDEGHKH